MEIKVKDFMELPRGKEAIEKELNEMRRRRFNDDEDIPEYLKRSALECRIICTTKRDGTMKARSLDHRRSKQCSLEHCLFIIVVGL